MAPGPPTAQPRSHQHTQHTKNNATRTRPADIGRASGAFGERISGPARPERDRLPSQRLCGPLTDVRVNGARLRRVLGNRPARDASPGAKTGGFAPSPRRLTPPGGRGPDQRAAQRPGRGIAGRHRRQPPHRVGGSTPLQWAPTRRACRAALWASRYPLPQRGLTCTGRPIKIPWQRTPVTRTTGGTPLKVGPVPLTGLFKLPDPPRERQRRAAETLGTRHCQGGATFYQYFAPPSLVGKGGHTLLLRGGWRGFDPRQLRRTKGAVFPPLAI